MTDSNSSLERLSESTEPLEQRINQYQANLKHIDELLRRARQATAGMPAQSDVHAQVARAKIERDKFSEHLEALKKMSSEQFSERIIEKSGPMGLWDAVAEDLEKLVERIERK